MTGFWIILGDWGYALAAALFTALAIMASRRPANAPAHTTLVIALTVTALWALHVAVGRAIGGVPALSGGVAETVRNGAWLTACWTLLNGAQDRSGARRLFVTLMAALACQLCLDLFLSEWEAPDDTALILFQSAWLLRAATALGAIFLLQGLYAGLDRDRGGGLGWLGCALAVMWAYEVQHYLLAFASDGQFAGVGQMRGLVMALIAPLIMLGTGVRERRRVALSRAATYQMTTLVVGALFALTLFTMVVLVRAIEDPAAQVVQLGAVFALSVMALILLPSAPFRAWLRVEIAKHLFTHRYDYREEWMRFAEAMAEPHGRGAVRAVARAVAAPGALLLLREEDGALAPEVEWNWPEAMAPDHRIEGDVAQGWAASAWIGEVDRLYDPIAAGLPGWIQQLPQSWALVPLVHGGEAVGAVLLQRPPGRGALDWEDLDLLRVIARQLALTLSEQRHQKALAEAQRFDEFNRRFAFILHDIKNMVSQMSLLAANAERHADNPAFRADMVLTLKETAGRMTDLIARLGRSDPPPRAVPAECDLAAIARAMRGRVMVEGEARLAVRGDAARLKQAIGHLVQNAIEATPEGGPPVRLRLSRDEGDARLTITDSGVGMSPAFLRDGLFRPFTSTKATGFGLGAHEARSIVTAMGGRLSVTSQEGKGTQFTLSLPLIGDEAAMPLLDRKAG